MIIMIIFQWKEYMFMFPKYVVFVCHNKTHFNLIEFIEMK